MGVASSEKFLFNGTVVYPTEIFFELMEKGHYTCYLKEDAALPIMYLDDCIDALMMFLKADKNKLKRTVYNLGGIKVVPKEFCDAVLKFFPGCTVEYKPDFRQDIAEQWPLCLDDSTSYEDWGWRYNITVDDFAKRIYDGIDPALKKK